MRYMQLITVKTKDSDISRLDEMTIVQRASCQRLFDFAKVPY